MNNQRRNQPKMSAIAKPHRRTRLFPLLALAFLCVATLAHGQATPNLGLTKPTVGNKNYPTTINTNYDILDTASASYVRYRPSPGSGLNLNVYTGKVLCGNPPTLTSYSAGTVALTDNTTNYVFLATTGTCAPTVNITGFLGPWPIAVVVTSGGAITSMTDARSWFAGSPVAYRADWFSGTNAGVKMAACLAAAEAAGGGICDATGLLGAQTIAQDIFSGITTPVVLWVNPNSNFTVTATQNIPSNATIVGEGWGQATFTDGVTGAAAEPMFKIGNANYIVLKGLKFVGTSNTGNLLSIIATSSVGHYEISEMVFRDTTGTGKDSTGTSMTSAGLYAKGVSSGLRIHHSEFLSNGRGLVLDGVAANAQNASEVLSNKFNSNVSDGIQTLGINGPLGTTISFNQFEANGGWGINSAGSLQGATVSGNYFESNTLGNISFTSYSAGIKISGNYLTSTFSNGPSISVVSGAGRCEDFSISANFFGIKGAGTLTSIITADFVNSSITDNVFAVQAGTTATNGVNLATGSGEIYARGNHLLTPAGGTLTRIINNVVKGTTYNGANPYYSETAGGNPEGYVVDLASTGIYQNATNGGLTVDANGSGAAQLNVRNPSGTGGTQFGDGAGNSVAEVTGVGVMQFQRLKASHSTLLVSGDFSIVGWGSGAAITAVSGNDQRPSIKITAGTGPSANPTVVLTFKDGTWTNAPLAAPLWVTDMTGAMAHLSIGVTATTLTITYNGTPVNASTYNFGAILMGR